MNTYPPYIVLNCPVTQILGTYDTYAEAEQAAEDFGQCSFPYELSPAERENLAKPTTETP